MLLDLQNILRELGKIIGYVSTTCPNCGRIRVEE